MANFVEELKPSFLRFPGGNNLYGHPTHTKLEQMPTNLRPFFFFCSEGESPGDRWKWNETIGPIQDRPGRQGESILNILHIYFRSRFVWMEQIVADFSLYRRLDVP